MSSSAWCIARKKGVVHMTDTEFVREVQKKEPGITWKDILEQSFRKHSREDMEKAMQASHPLPAQSMWLGWQRPWLWWEFAKYGLGLVAILYGLFYGCAFFLKGGVTETLVHMVMIIPPIVIPFIIMVLLWELNVPRNISFMELMSYFLFGGILTFAINSLFFIPFPSGMPSFYAALREEPAKLAASLLLLLYAQKVQKKQICGLTGLVIGAAVGAAFSGFESVSYAINSSDNVLNMIDVQLLRALLALGGHITYCMPYVTAIALHMENGKFSVKSFLNPMAIGSFAFSVLLHAIWNGSGSFLIQLIIVAGSVFILLYWIKAALHQVAPGNIPQESHVTQPAYPQESQVTQPADLQDVPAPGGDPITLCIKSTPLAGSVWESRGQPMVIGRQRDACLICFPDDTRGISRQHCKVVRTPQGWCIQDLNSSYGTYVDGRKLAPYELCPLAPGKTIHLGSKQVWLTVL